MESHIINQSSIEAMGCENSQLMKQPIDMKISIIDSGFMKPEYEIIRQKMQESGIYYDLFISSDCFFDQFAKRYYNKVVVKYDHYSDVSTRLRNLKYSPNIYVILNGNKIDQNLSFNVKAVENYEQLIRCLEQKKMVQINDGKSNEKSKKKNWGVKILCKPGARTSEETVFESALKKANIEHQFYNSFQVLEQSIEEGDVEFIVTNYIYHKQVIELVKNKKTRVVCYCSFEKDEEYDPSLYSVSNNYLEITADIKQEIANKNKAVVKCTKAYIYTNDLDDYQEISDIIEEFDIEVRPFSNIESMIKETTYFFCITVLANENQMKKLKRIFEQQGILFRVKLISIPASCKPKLENLFKIIRTIKKGYFTQKAVTHSVDIIDKHYDNVKFQSIKKQLQKNEIGCFGYLNLSAYIKQKKFLSSFIICNYEQRILLNKYLKQLQSKAKVIIFCNKNKIDSEFKFNKSFAFVSSHFGKIIKYIQKTPVFTPSFPRENEREIDQKIENIKNKNKRISALKWSGFQSSDVSKQNQTNFQFLNISKDTNTGSIRDIQQSVSSLWKVQSSLSTNLSGFKDDFIKSLKELVKIYKISYPPEQLNELLDKIKGYSFNELLMKVKDYFEAENQLGLDINNSLINTQICERNEIISMRQFLMVTFANYFSGFSVPNIGTMKLKKWVSHQLIEKCEVGSYLFCKNFMIFYEENPFLPEVLTPYKIELEMQYNSLNETEIYLNSYITNKDKFIFSPFSQFQVLEIRNCGQFKTIVLKYIKNVEFLKYIFEQNMLEKGSKMATFVENIRKNPSKFQFVDETNREQIMENLDRCSSIQLFRNGRINEAIELHQKLKRKAQEKENLNSELVNNLTFQLACFNLQGENPNETAFLIKELMESNPGEFIKSQCQQMIKQVTKSQAMSEISQQQDKSEQQDLDHKVTQKIITQKSSVKLGKSIKNISDEAMKTFIWLKNKQQCSSSSQSQQSQAENNCIQNYETDFKCLEIDEMNPLDQQFGTDITNQIK